MRKNTKNEAINAFKQEYNQKVKEEAEKLCADFGNDISLVLTRTLRRLDHIMNCIKDFDWIDAKESCEACSEYLRKMKNLVETYHE
jgi:hypothetical protein